MGAQRRRIEAATGEPVRQRLPFAVVEYALERYVESDVQVVDDRAPEPLGVCQRRRMQRREVGEAPAFHRSQQTAASALGFPRRPGGVLHTEECPRDIGRTIHAHHYTNRQMCRPPATSSTTPVM